MHIFELRNEEINVKKILAVINATALITARIFFTFNRDSVYPFRKMW